MAFLAKRKKAEMTKRWSTEEVQRTLRHRFAQNARTTRKAFRVADMEASGRLGAARIRDMLSLFNIEMVDEDFWRWWRHVNPAGDGTVDIDGFLWQYRSDHHVPDEDRAVGLVRHANQPNKKPAVKPKVHLTPDEVRRIVGDHCVTRLKRFQSAFLRVDANHDGYVSKREFARALEVFNIMLTPRDLDTFWAELTLEDDGGGGGGGGANNDDDVVRAGQLNWQHFIKKCAVAKHQITPTAEQESATRYEQRLTECMNKFAPGETTHGALQLSPRILADGHMGAFIGSGLSGAFERSRQKAVRPRYRLSNAPDAIRVMRAKFASAPDKVRRAFRYIDAQDAQKVTIPELRELLGLFLLRFTDDDYSRLLALLKLTTKETLSFARFRKAFGNIDPPINPRGIEWGVTAIQNDKALQLGYFDVKSPICVIPPALNKERTSSLEMNTTADTSATKRRPSILFSQSRDADEDEDDGRFIVDTGGALVDEAARRAQLMARDAVTETSELNDMNAATTYFLTQRRGVGHPIEEDGRSPPNLQQQQQPPVSPIKVAQNAPIKATPSANRQQRQQQHHPAAAASGSSASSPLPSRDPQLSDKKNPAAVVEKGASSSSPSSKKLDAATTTSPDLYFPTVDSTNRAPQPTSSSSSMVPTKPTATKRRPQSARPAANDYVPPARVGGGGETTMMTMTPRGGVGEEATTTMMTPGGRRIVIARPASAAPSRQLSSRGGGGGAAVASYDHRGLLQVDTTGSSLLPARPASARDVYAFKREMVARERAAAEVHRGATAMVIPSAKYTAPVALTAANLERTARLRASSLLARAQQQHHKTNPRNGSIAQDFHFVGESPWWGNMVEELWQPKWKSKSA